MKKIIFLLFIYLFSVQLFAQNTNELREELNKIISAKNATIGVSIKSIEDKDTLSINGKLNAPLMSVFKFHIALATLNLVDKEKLTLTQKFLKKKRRFARRYLEPNTRRVSQRKYVFDIRSVVEIHHFA